jgi:hypothetical protein
MGFVRWHVQDKSGKAKSENSFEFHFRSVSDIMHEKKCKKTCGNPWTFSVTLCIVTGEQTSGVGFLSARCNCGNLQEL